MAENQLPIVGGRDVPQQEGLGSLQNLIKEANKRVRGTLGPAAGPVEGLLSLFDLRNIPSALSSAGKDLETGVTEGDPKAMLAGVLGTALVGAENVPGGRAASKASKNLQDIISDEKKLDEFKDQYKKQYGVSQKQKQKPEVKEAVEKRLAGEITGKEQRDITKKFLPLEPITKMVKVPFFEDIVGSLKKDKIFGEKKKGIVNLNTELESGQRVASRLDIPAYEGYDTWVVSFHDGRKQGGDAIGYGKTANLTNVDFSSSAKTAANIASEKPVSLTRKELSKKLKRELSKEEYRELRELPENMKKTSKSTIARMYGDYNKVPDEDVVARAERILAGKVEDSNKYIDPEDGSEWIQVGMNPYRASYFVDKNTGTPLKSAEEMIQVGPLVFARGSQRLKPSDFKKDKSLTTRTDAGKTIPFKKGGSVIERNPYNYTARAI
jgi:hypothetical protein